MRSKFRSFGLVLIGVVAGILISLNLQAIADREAHEPLPVDELRAFTDVFGAIKRNYVEPVPDKKLITGAINGMLSDLDPHSAYLDKDAYRELQVGTQGQFGGLGIEVGMEDGFVKVISPIEDTPAFRAGIKPGDLIVKLDQTPVKGMTLNDAVKRMRGKPDTKITLTILRKGESKPIVVTLTRAIIHVKSVKSKMGDLLSSINRGGSQEGAPGMVGAVVRSDVQENGRKSTTRFRGWSDHPVPAIQSPNSVEPESPIGTASRSNPTSWSERERSDRTDRNVLPVSRTGNPPGTESAGPHRQG